MMTIINILIYVFFAFFASYLAKQSEDNVLYNDLDPYRWDKYLTYFVLFFTVICAIRWNVGSDSISYAYHFSHPKEDEVIEKERLWHYVQSFFYSIGAHWSIWLGLCALIQIFFITKALQPYRWLLVFIPFALFGGKYWQYLNGAVRQMIVACGFLWASRFIYEKKLWKYLAFVAIASMIHQSALILLPFYLIPNRFNISNRRIILIMILLICVFLGQNPAFQSAVKYVQMIAHWTDYDHYGDLMSGVLVKGGVSQEALNFGPMMLSYLLIPIFIIWYGPELKEEYGEEIPYFNLWYNLAYFYACGYFLVCNIGHIFIRFTMYFSLFEMVLISLLLYHLITQFRTYGIRQLALYALCIVIATNTTWNVMKTSGIEFESTTYKVFFFNKDQVKKFDL